VSRLFTTSNLACRMRRSVARRSRSRKALCLCMPVTGKHKERDASGTEVERMYQLFVLKNHWFVLSQTEGNEYTPEPLPEWNEDVALQNLNIRKTDFDLLDGNAQGYAALDRLVSVSPIAKNPLKTLFHEIAHVLLDHSADSVLADTDHTPRSVKELEAESVAMLCCASLGLPGIEYSRAYIQSWAQGESISDKSAQRIFGAADKILKAGMVECPA